jgi:hypothetical protein
MGQNAKTSLGVAEPSGGFLAAEAFDEIGPQGLVLAMSGVGGLKEESGHSCYFI